jgi:hypothetical protein
MTKVYRSKVDTWLLCILVGAMIVAGLGALSTLVVAAFNVPLLAFVALLPLFIGVGFPIWILRTTKYTLTDDRLFVRSAFFTWRINLNEIYRVVPTSNPLSSPALSLRRLRIEYGNGRSIMISPEDQEGFLRDLRSRTHFEV